MAIDQTMFRSVLLLALDKTEEALAADKEKLDREIQNGTSKAESTQTEKEVIESVEFLDRFLKTDVKKKLTRMPIIFDDSFIPAHHVGSSTNMNKFVDYDQKEVAVEPASNGLSIQIQIKNSLSAFSTIAAIFSGLTYGEYDLFTTNPRVSFFSANTCIFNAYLSGVTRQTEPGSDMEAINLSLEHSEPNPDDPADPKAGAESDTPTDVPPFELSDDFDAPAAAAEVVGLPADLNKTNTDGRVFFWYRLTSLLLVTLQEPPQLFGIKTVNNLPYEVHHVESIDLEGQLRQAITVRYDRVYLPVGMDGHYPYYNNGYAVDVVDGLLFLGIEAQA